VSLLKAMGVLGCITRACVLLSTDVMLGGNQDKHHFSWAWLGQVFHTYLGRFHQHGILDVIWYGGPLYTTSVKAKVQLKSSITIGAKVQISPQGLYTRSPGQNRKNIFSICPKLRRNAELYGLVTSPKMLKVGLNKFFQPWPPSLKQAWAPNWNWC